MPERGGVGKVDGDLAVLDASGGAGVLALHAHRVRALLQVAGLIHDQQGSASGRDHSRGPWGLVAQFPAPLAHIMSSKNMAPTYEPGDEFISEPVDGSEVRRGDVVLFSVPKRYPSTEKVMQRVIGVGGDRVVCCTGDGPGSQLSVNGKPVRSRM